MARTLATNAGRGAALLCALIGLTLLVSATAGGASISALQQKLSAGREEASSLAGALQAIQGELAAAEGEATKAKARERKLTALLATGEEKAARLAAEVRKTQRQLILAKKRLRRARRVLAERLVAMYESGAPDTASVILAADSFDEIATRTEYLNRIQQSDSALAQRVAAVRRTVAVALHRVAELEARVDAYNERLAAARSEVAGVRADAEAAAAHLGAIEASRQASLAKLKTSIGTWVEEIQAAKAARAERISAEEAEGEVERWLGGPYAIPAYIVMCESGGNYGAVNPSSGAGGAYQILPSTWQLYGGQGEPQNAPKAEQDRIAGEIWADSGPSAWVCG
ncbi:MAG TPA: transglycosylase family protein [Solirubrobacterales bacterium]|nr:transglycosylase family protein [Solirubrobacterales bacterium]